MPPSSLRAAIAAALLGLASILSGCTGRPDGIEPVGAFDVQRYAGRWYEIARLDHGFERGLTNVTAIYTVRPDGSVGVLNRGLDRRTCRWQEIEGRAVLQGAPDTASLSVTFFWPFAGGYHVFALDRQDYAWAMVAGPTRDYLWILARQPILDPRLRDELAAKARAAGFAIDRLIWVDQSAPDCPL